MMYFCFYHWLDGHPTEVVLLSLQYEGSTTEYGSNDAEAQLKLFNTLTSPVATQYLLQMKDEFGTLGQARGKIVLLRRFDLDHLSNSYENALPGLHFSPALWTDNSPAIKLIYNNSNNSTAYIEDYYEPQTPSPSNATVNIQWKYNATTAHLLKAADESLAPDSLWWTWASGGKLSDGITPELMAIGNGTYTPDGGINQKLVNFLKGMKGKRVGIVMFDFYETPGDLIETLLSL
ncbi:724e29fa-ea1e-4671-aa3e-70969d9d4ee6 [Sclerotinia trifoliorum]|uniref:724e29fa-ea1e-4671-aa3e-70969d9d4ee6 n=1 Tax=Sclerotinia trifoliorum TaxID=28548 RepID=A0A8H2ZVP7_9HELO|nr:724e29fa-ea1e-4671-aa3e-70969d9d4ee6 [Sclerotinia trifoliorum]